MVVPSVISSSSRFGGKPRLLQGFINVTRHLPVVKLAFTPDMYQTSY